MGWCGKHINGINELMGRNQNENIQVEGKSGAASQRLISCGQKMIMSKSPVLLSY